MSSDSTGSTESGSFKIPQTVKSNARKRKGRKPMRYGAPSPGKHCPSSEGQKLDGALESLREAMLNHSASLKGLKDVLSSEGQITEVKEAVEHLTETLINQIAKARALKDALNPHDPDLAGCSEKTVRTLKEAIGKQRAENRAVRAVLDDPTVSSPNSKELGEALEFLKEATRKHNAEWQALIGLLSRGKARGGEASR